MRQYSLKIEQYNEETDKLNAKLILFLLGILLLVGLLFLYVKIESVMLISRFDGLLNDEVVNTNQYETVTAEAVKKQVFQLARRTKFLPRKMKVYVTIQPKKLFESYGHYYKKNKMLNFSNISNQKSEKIPGCSMQDALPPKTTLQDLVRGGQGKRNILNRFEGVVAKDARAVLTGRNIRQRTPEKAIILAVDILVKHKILLFQRYFWFHRRCFFYAARRPYQESSELKELLK